MKVTWFGFWIRVYYAFRLRGPINSLQRLLKGELWAPRKALQRFATPKDLEVFATTRFEYRLDQTRVFGWVVPLDWVTEPEVFQVRIDDGVQKDGDCDDYHAWAATCLARMPGIRDVMLLSVGGRDEGKGWGHAVCVFFDESAGAWRLLDYTLRKLDDPNDAPRQVARDRGITFYVFERVDADGPTWDPVAIGPNGKVPV